jgi:hypothetical protein
MEITFLIGGIFASIIYFIFAMILRFNADIGPIIAFFITIFLMITMYGVFLL